MFVTHFMVILCIPIIFGQSLSLPKNPSIGDTVVLKCILNAPEGMKFTSIAPKLRINQSDYSISFDEITDNLNNDRYYGLHLPDEDRTSLRGDITIFFIRETDFNTKFTCLAQLDNDEFVELMLDITQSDTEQSPTNATSNCTTQTVCPTDSTEECTFLKSITGLLSSLLSVNFVIVIMVIFPFGICILFKKYLHRADRSVVTKVIQDTKLSGKEGENIVLTKISKKEFSVDGNEEVQ